MKILPPLLCALLVATALPVAAEVSRESASAAAQQQSGGGRVLAAERASVNGRAVWRIKVVTPQGEVRVIVIDLATGKAL